jgi:Calcineurin-like phosphoesterase
MKQVLAILLLFPIASLSQNSPTWSFAVSGDSRNCGDIVMPAIAAGARADHADFYWHLGDFRWLYDFDQDLLSGPEYRDGKQHLSVFDYQRLAWNDFIARQLVPFGETPVHLGIGNHELAPPFTRADYLQQFADWLDTSELRAQRLKDDPRDHQLRTYYRWIQGGVDFISLDNASNDQFDDAQARWIEQTLARDQADSSVRAVVVGLHKALPDSLSAGHSMDESAQQQRSGRRVYQDLVQFRERTHKRVYVLASHSHFYMTDIYKDACHSQPASVLPGWIVGTAGATRYRLPKNTGEGKAQTDVYGYLLGTVSANGEIQFEFKQVPESRVPADVIERYGEKQVDACFKGNQSPYVPDGPTCE